MSSTCRGLLLPVRVVPQVSWPKEDESKKMTQMQSEAIASQPGETKKPGESLLFRAGKICRSSFHSPNGWRQESSQLQRIPTVSKALLSNIDLLSSDASTFRVNSQNHGPLIDSKGCSPSHISIACLPIFRALRANDESPRLLAILHPSPTHRHPKFSPDS